jgi:Sec-independent protein translocase protein TatA
MGKGIKEFKKGLNEIENPSEDNKSKETSEKKVDK